MTIFEPGDPAISNHSKQFRSISNSPPCFHTRDQRHAASNDLRLADTLIISAFHWLNRTSQCPLFPSRNDQATVITPIYWYGTAILAPVHSPHPFGKPELVKKSRSQGYWSQKPPQVAREKTKASFFSRTWLQKLRPPSGRIENRERQKTT